MFQAIASVISDAGLKGVDVGIRIVGKGAMSVMLSFNHGSEFNLKLLEKSDDANITSNAEKIVALRAALNTPLVVVGSPDELLGKLETAIQNLREGVVLAATTYSDLDITALLTKAASQAKAAKSGAKGKAAPTTAKSEPAKAESDVEDEDAGSEDSGSEDDADVVDATKQTKSKQEVKSEPAPAQTDFGGFEVFDSL